MTLTALFATVLSACIAQKINHANGMYFLELGFPFAFIRQERHLGQDVISKMIHRPFYMASCLEHPTEIIWSSFFVDVLSFLVLIFVVCCIVKKLSKS